MAVGDVVSGISSISASASLTIQPGAGAEWVIHNIYYANAITINFTDGTNTIAWETDSAAGARIGLVTHVNNTRYVTVTNNAGTAQLIGYDGVVTK